MDKWKKHWNLYCFNTEINLSFSIFCGTNTWDYGRRKHRNNSAFCLLWIFQFSPKTFLISPTFYFEKIQTYRVIKRILQSSHIFTIQIQQLLKFWMFAFYVCGSFVKLFENKLQTSTHCTPRFSNLPLLKIGALSSINKCY